MNTRDAQTQRTAGRIMIGVGVAGAVLALVGTIVAWVFVGELHAATDETLTVTIHTLDAVDDTIDLAATVIDSTRGAVDALTGTLTAVSGSFDTGTNAIDEVAGLADTLGPSLQSAADATAALERLGTTIDSVLSAVSSLPVVPTYDPENGLGDTFGQLADAIGPIPGQLAVTAESLTDFTAAAGGLQDELDELTASVQQIGTDLAATDRLIEQYRASVDDARRLATDAQTDLDGHVRLLRILLTLGGATLLIGQIVPLWIGRSVLDEARIAAAQDADDRIPA